MKKVVYYFLAASATCFVIILFISAAASNPKQDVVYLVGEVVEAGTQISVKGLAVNKYDSKTALDANSPSFTCETYPKFYIQHVLRTEEAKAGKYLKNSFYFTDTYIKIFDPAFDEYLPLIIPLVDVNKTMNGDTVQLGQFPVEKKKK